VLSDHPAKQRQREAMPVSTERPQRRRHRRDLGHIAWGSFLQPLLAGVALGLESSPITVTTRSASRSNAATAKSGEVRKNDRTGHDPVEGGDLLLRSSTRLSGEAT